MKFDQLEINRTQRINGHRPAWLNAVAVMCAVLLLLFAAWWSIIRSGDALRLNIASKLETVLRIESEAVRQWMSSERELAGLLASDPQLAELMESNASESVAKRVEAKLRSISSKLDNKTCLLMTIDGRVVSRSGDSWLMTTIKTLEDQFCETLLSGEPTSSAVLEPVEGGSATAVFGVVVAAPIRNHSDEIVGFLGIGHDLRTELTKVLSSSHSGKSGETVAVTGAGLLISESRFEGTEWPMTFITKMHEQPEQRLASAIQTDLSGLTDQRGIKSVISSKWLPRLGFGLVTKMDQSEANAPVNQILYFAWTLFGLLLLSGLSTLFYRWYLFKVRLLAKKVELSQKKLGAYEIEEKIGEGGMGVVYKAKHALMRRPTAVKILPPERSSQESIERFEREVQFTSQLKHPNSIAIYDYGRTENGLFYYAMELLDGLNLQQLVRVEGPLPDGRVINIMIQICDSLREAHALGLIHRDIKPANIMLCNRGGAYDMVKVLDFGMVRGGSSPYEHKDSLSGTPSYMAPESFTDPKGVDARVDIFAVGAVGFYLLTGKPLLDVRNLNELIEIHRSNLSKIARECIRGDAKRRGMEISEELIGLIARCVSVSKHDRPESISKLLLRLRHCSASIVWNDAVAEKWWRDNNFSRLDFASEPTQVIDRKNGISLDKTQSFIAASQARPNDSIHRYMECEFN